MNDVRGPHSRRLWKHSKSLRIYDDVVFTWLKYDIRWSVNQDVGRSIQYCHLNVSTDSYNQSATTVFTARCYAEPGYAMASCLSVRCRSVTLRYLGHIGIVRQLSYNDPLIILMILYTQLYLYQAVPVNKNSHA